MSGSFPWIRVLRLDSPHMSRYVSAAVFVLLIFLMAAPLSAAQPQRRSPGKPLSADGKVRTFQSKNFVIHTDLSAEEANTLLGQLETMLKLIANYWGRPPRGPIECCVVKDLADWPQDLLSAMEPEGLAKIREGAGVCKSTTVTAGKKFMSKSRVYAVAKDGVPLHEAVHAYAHQTFGRAGPQWYAEGMAEIGHYWKEGQKGVHVPEHVIRYLRQTTPRKLEDLIVNKEQLGGSWEDYCWWWLLCYFLDNNANYYAQFRAFGREVLAGRQVTFQQVFESQMDQLKFEFYFFLQHLQPGFRMDLCSWDWKKKFSPAERAVTVVVQADRGWQPSGLTLKAGREYQYEASGEWKIGKEGKSFSADGGPDGNGRLVGILLKDYTLGEEFALGAKGVFTAPGDGDLYLRCRVAWPEIAENSGRVTVQLRPK